MLFVCFIPCVCVGVAVAEVVHVDAVLLQAAGALLDSRQETSPVAAPVSSLVDPPGQRPAVCNRTHEIPDYTNRPEKSLAAKHVCLFLHFSILHAIHTHTHAVEESN